MVTSVSSTSGIASGLRPRRSHPPIEFAFMPSVVVWEVTRAGAGVHRDARAEATRHGPSIELTTYEGFRLIDQVRSFGARPPLLALTGSEPMRRPDLAELVAYATG